MNTDIVEAQFTPSSALAVERPVDYVAAALQSSQDFDRLKTALLDRERHMLHIQGKDRVNASGWQKLSAALRINVEFVSKNAAGHNGCYREVLENANGKKIVSFSCTVRAVFGDRYQERNGRCDSTEVKHNQNEHKLESVAFTRAFNRAVCAIVGGEPGDNIDDVDEVRDDQSKPTSRDTPVQYSVDYLKDVHDRAGAPDGSLGNFLLANFTWYKRGSKLTPEQSHKVKEVLDLL